MTVAKKAVFAIVIVFLLAGIAQADKYSGGTGEPNSPYKIETAEDLNDIGNHVEDFNKCFVMVNDINLADYTGTQFNVIGHFSGVFDGNGHSVSNFTYGSPGSGCIGLFASVGLEFGPTGRIKNLTLVAPNVDVGTGDWVGALVGSLHSGTISGCFVRGGHIRGENRVGGLVGHTPDGYGTKIIADCCSTATVSGGNAVGGLAGYFTASKGEGLVLNCSSSGSVSGDDDVGGLVGDFHGYVSGCHSSAIVSGNEHVGALIGSAKSKPYYFSQIVQCSADGNVSGGYEVGGLLGSDTESDVADCVAAGTVAGAQAVGGLVGRGSGAVTNCYSTGSVSGWSEIGGLAGTAYGTITNSYATGDVSGNLGGDNIGGLVGIKWYGLISNCWASGNVSAGVGEIGGLVGHNVDGDITRSYATGEIICPDALFAGGLVGRNTGDVSNCFSTGDVSGYAEIGGLIGVNAGDLTHCYATGRVDGNEQPYGALIGNHGSSTCAGCFWDSDVNPDVNGIGNANEPNVMGKSTVQMQTQNTFTDAGWDFVGETINGSSDIWTIHETVDYPKHVWPLVNFIGWYEVDFLDYAYFAGRWSDENCGLSDDCDGADLDFSDKVDWADLKIFCDHWLEGASY